MNMKAILRTAGVALAAYAIAMRIPAVRDALNGN